jgi:RNA polymerase sigma factor (sigma-70 family)
MTPRSLLAPARLGGQPILRAQTDDRLVALARSGSRPAFEAIVSRYRRPLVAYCTRFLGAERAEDAVQQTFVRAWTALTAGEQVRALRSWLYRIAHNTSLNMLRDRALLHEPLSDQIDGVERPDQAVERRQELQEVLSAVQALPARQRDAIVLRALEGRSYEQIAQGLGVSDGAVRQLLNRARCTMRAGVAAITPVGLLARIAAPLGDAPATVLAGSGGGGGTLAAGKLCTAAVAAAIAGGGVSGLPDRPAEGPAKSRASLGATLKPAQSATAASTRRVSRPARSGTLRTRPTAQRRTQAQAVGQVRERGRDDVRPRRERRTEEGRGGERRRDQGDRPGQHHMPLGGRDGPHLEQGGAPGDGGLYPRRDAGPGPGGEVTAAGAEDPRLRGGDYGPRLPPPN